MLASLRRALASLLDPSARRLLARYPADAPLWRDGEGEAELRGLLAQRTARLERLAQRLRTDGIHLAAGLATDDPAPLIAALDAWCDSIWKGFARYDAALTERWCRRSWPEAAEARRFTLITDLAVALGERAIACDAQRWRWGVDDYAEHAADGAASFGRLVVLDGSLARDAASPPVVDPLGLSFARYLVRGYGSGPAERFIDGMRPVLWSSHRALYSAT